MASAEFDPQAVALHRLPEDIRAALTTEQVDRLAHLIAKPNRHALAWRASTSLLGRNFYLAVVSGRETRSPGRVRSEGLAMSITRFMVRIIAVAAWITTVALICAVAGAVLLYLVKSHLGIDLMDGPSPLHHYFF
jgi:hypothetical protein